MSDLQARLSRLSSEQRRWLLDQLESGRAWTAPKLARRPSAGDGDEAPLSFGQERIWLIDRLHPGSPVYNLPIHRRISGPLDVRALAAALREIVRRHEILRTAYVDRADGAVQRVESQPATILPVIDLARLDAPARWRAARRLGERDARRGFDLSRPPVRLALLHLGADDHVLLFNVHHIAFDGWSTGVLLRELRVLYAARRAGTPASLPALPVQYSGFARWQRQRLRGDLLAEQLAYWRAELEGVPLRLDLPADRPAPASGLGPGGLRTSELGDRRSEALRRIARRERTTSFVVLLAGFAAWLHRWASVDDLVVGTPVAGRREGHHGVIGFFVNTVLLRARPRPDLGFRDLVGDLRRRVPAAYEHQDLPYERVVEVVAGDRTAELRHAPVQLLFSYEKGDAGELGLAEVEVSPMRISVPAARADLTLVAQETQGRFVLNLEQRRDRFSAASSRRMIRQVARVLGQVGRYPDRPIACLSLLSVAERHQILHEWDEGGGAAGGDAAGLAQASLPVLFGRRVEQGPDAVAVVERACHLTRSGLAVRARRLAGQLRALGVRRGGRVAIHLERSTDFVVAAVAVVEADGVYLPLDPSHPAERLGAMLADAGAAAMIVGAGGMGELAYDGPVVAVDRAPAGPVAAVDPCAGSGDDLAYVIYTSGSTGLPKGVAVSHRAVAQLVLDNDYVRLGSGDRVGHLSNTSFDAATFEIWGPLLAGAAAVVVAPAVALSSHALADALARYRIGTLFLTTALFQHLARSEPDIYSGLDRLLFGGEAVDPERVREVLAGAPPASLLHVYGPTECTTFSTWRPVRSVAAQDPTVPIGRPLSRTRVRVLDRAGRPAPVSGPGELTIGGLGLAVGYLGRPGLTAERFVPDPWAPEPGLRLYRTGDRVRRDPRGEIDFLGRFDNQVKLRGFRIELGEVEACLRRHPQVAAATVVVRGEGESKALAGYVAAGAGARPAVSDLKGYLRARLPEFMVPSFLAVLDRLPLNANGKVDRRRLPAPGSVAPEPADTSAPRTPVEELVAEIWREVLDTPCLGRDDDFFDRGGNSLAGSRVSARVRERTGLDVPLRLLFEEPTVAAYSRQVEGLLRGVDAEPPPPLRRLPRDGELPLSFGQERFWFLHQLDPDGAAFNVGTALRLFGPLSVPALEQAVSELVRRHEVLRASFREQEGEPRQSILAPRRLRLPLADLGGLREGDRGRERQRLLEEAAARPFRLDRGGLFRGRLVRVSAVDHALQLSLHHIVCDGWSIGLALREIGKGYAAFAAGEPSALPEPAIHYVDYAGWQRRWLRGEVMEQQLDYWRGRAANLPPLTLPGLNDQGRTPSFRGAIVRVELPPERGAQVRELGRRLGATPFVVLLTAFKALLALVGGCRDVVVGTNVSNRHRSELEDLIGFFVNNLVLRTDLSDAPTFPQLLARVRDVTLAAFAHQDVPYEKVIEALRPGTSRSYAPLYQVAFSLNSFQGQAPELPDLEVDPIGQRVETSNFYLTLAMTETDGTFAGSLLYDREVFERASVVRLARQYERLLASWLDEPERRLDDLSLGLGEEIAEMVAAFNESY